MKLSSVLLCTEVKLVEVKLMIKERDYRVFRRVSNFFIFFSPQIFTRV